MMLKHGSMILKQSLHTKSFVKNQYNCISYMRWRVHVSVVGNLTKISLRTYAANLKSNQIQQRAWLLPITERNVKFVANTLEPREKLILLKYLLKLISETDLYADNGEIQRNPKKQTQDFLEKVDTTLKSQSQKLDTIEKLTEFVKSAKKPTKRELLNLSIHAGLPYFIFGYLDNFLMVIFGDLLDSYLGPLGYTSLTSAALGNVISDVISVFLSVYVEKIIHYFSAFTKVQISESQEASFYVKRVTELSKPIYVAMGTIIGMWPLYFL